MLPTASSPIPEPGQIVTVRQRRYVVVDVQKSTLPVTPLATHMQAGQHLLTLNSIEDDALGETLQVIWEIEPGTSIEERISLPQPDGFDTPDRLDAFLNAVRWGAISSADIRALQAPFRSGIDIEDYQLDPLVRAIQMPRANLLIADDVGLGKTIETGLVIQELIVRNRARTVLVVCPAGLQTHWRDQMRDKFGLEFRIVDSLLMKQLRRSRGIHTNPWTHFPRLITSIDFIKRDTPLRLFREVLPAQNTYPRRFDILVVDEAHNVSPSGSTHYAIDSQRTQAIREITPHFEHKLFLSATPHNGYPESFSALLELLDNQRFARGVPPARRQLEMVMVRRLKSEIKDAWGDRRFPKRMLDVIEVPYTEEERQVHRWLQEYSQSRQRNAKDQEERFAVEFVLKLLKKRLFSSPAAFALTLAKHMDSVKGQKRVVQPKQMTLGVLRRQLAQINEDYADDEQYEEDAKEAVGAAAPLIHDLTAQEQALLEKMYAWAERAAQIRDSKAEAFIAWLKAIVKPERKWSDERVIVFTEYRATQNWLNTLLAAAGLTEGERLLTLYGGMDDEQRERIKAAFQASPEQSAVRILLATDAASEGIDLQNYCHRLVHFEIPWNPNRMEQRNGRVDRHGQQHDVLIYHFVSKGYKKHTTADDLPVDEMEADLEFLARAAEKVEHIREDLGKVGAVIAAQVEEAMLGKRLRLDTQLAEDDARALHKLLKFERDLRRQVEQYAQQLHETRQNLKLAPESIQNAVRVALEIAGQPPLIPAHFPSPAGGRGHGDVQQPGGEGWHLPALRGSWQECTMGLRHPHTGEIRPIVFDHGLAKGRDDVVLAHLNHRLVQMALRLLRAEVWSPQGRKGLHRITARAVPNHALANPVVIAHARLVLVGGEGARLHEEIITAGGEIVQGRFRRLNVTQVQNALETATHRSVSTKTQGHLQSAWATLEPSLLQALDARQRDRLDGMQKLLAERRAKEISDIRLVLGELRAKIERELDDPEYKQLEFWSTSERDQYNRNVQALRLRLKQIPEEMEKEIAAIEKRYADPQPRLFPVAMTFLVPEKYA
ncbi:MAG: DISARM system SNF2-like helicase DrmD [Anaerolineaceae bacterium]|nr:DISARM system SNF2-like helicase DrmD [Anaerolineaceae bacterium]